MEEFLKSIDEAVQIIERHNTQVKELHLVYHKDLFDILTKEQRKAIWKRYQPFKIYFIINDEEKILNKEGELE